MCLLGTMIGSPVIGLCLMRAGRKTGVKLPNPRSSTLSPEANALVICPRMLATPNSTSRCGRCPCLSANRWTSSDLFIAFKVKRYPEILPRARQILCTSLCSDVLPPNYGLVTTGTAKLSLAPQGASLARLALSADCGEGAGNPLYIVLVNILPSNDGLLTISLDGTIGGWLSRPHRNLEHLRDVPCITADVLVQAL